MRHDPEQCLHFAEMPRKRRLTVDIPCLTPRYANPLSVPWASLINPPACENIEPLGCLNVYYLCVRPGSIPVTTRTR